MRFPRRIAGSFLLAAVFAAAVLAARSGVAAPDRAKPIAPHEFDPQITAADFSTHVQVLASDAFGGRAPDTDGEEKSVQYVRAMFQQLGLQPGNGDSYFQSVPVVASVLDAGRSRVD